MSVREFIIGDTVKLTWINSGVTPSSISAALYNGIETLVSSVSMTSSGDGHYYARITLPSSVGYYVTESIAQISGYPYKRRQLIKAVTGDSD